MVPNHPLYQLSHTPIGICYILHHIDAFVNNIREKSAVQVSDLIHSFYFLA